jgi:hypothetical protein
MLIPENEHFLRTRSASVIGGKQPRAGIAAYTVLIFYTVLGQEPTLPSLRSFIAAPIPVPPSLRASFGNCYRVIANICRIYR